MCHSVPRIRVTFAAPRIRVTYNRIIVSYSYVVFSPGLLSGTLCFIRVFYPDHIVVYIVGQYPNHRVDGVLVALILDVSPYPFMIFYIRVLVYIYSLASLSGSLVILLSGSIPFLSLFIRVASSPLRVHPGHLGLIPFYPGHFPFYLGHVLFPSGFHPLLSPSHPGHIRFPSTVPRLFRPSGARASIFFP